MTTRRALFHALPATGAALAAEGAAAPARAQPARFDALAAAPFAGNRPTAETAATLLDELLFQRATQAYLWALPLLSTLGMKLGSERAFGAGYDVLPVWKRRLDARTLVTTPNSDVLYAMGYADLGRDGPLVFEAPPRMQGILMDAWQRPIPVDGGRFFGDVGFAGPDGGEGGRMLLLPPGHAVPVPAGHHVYRSGTNLVFVFLRAFYDDPNDLAPAVRLMERSRIAPLAGPARPMRFPDASGVPVDMLPLRDGRAFDALKALVDDEGTNLADADGLGALAAIGIARGRPFAPDAHARAILDRAARTGYRASRVIGFLEEVGGRSYRMYPDRRWLNPFPEVTAANPVGPVDLNWMWSAAGRRDLDARIWYFTNYYAVSPGMISTRPGTGAMYPIAFTDGEGRALSGANSYRLRLPPDVPAALFWSLTLYEAENGSGLANGRPFPSLGSRDNPARNADGSTDLFIGPREPQGRGANWLPTPPERGWFAVFRLYGPTERALDRSWRPGDIERVG